MKYCDDTRRVSFTVLSPVAGYLNTLLILKPDVRRPINLAPLSPSSLRQKSLRLRHKVTENKY